MLDDGGFRPLATSVALSSFALARDGTLWAGGVGGLARIDGERVEAVDMDGAPKGLLDLAVDPAGRVWVVGYDAIGRHDDRGWVTMPHAEIAADLDHARSIAATADGHVLLAAMRGVYAWDGASWTREGFAADLFARDPMFGVVRASVDGEHVALATSDGVIEGVDGAWRRVDWDLRMGDDDLLDVGPGGRLAQPSIDGRLVIRRGGEIEDLRLAELGVRGRDISALVIDDATRVWLVTDAGLEILDAERTPTTYPASSVPALTGRLEGLIVLGEGPAALPEPGPLRTGAVSGRVLVDGEVAAGVEVEICARPELIHEGDSPCATAPLRRATTTDADGRFRLDDVPVAHMGFALRFGAQWKLIMGPPCCLELEPGGVLELRELALDGDSRQ
jgi:hypothetical protein